MANSLTIATDTFEYASASISTSLESLKLEDDRMLLAGNGLTRLISDIDLRRDIIEPNWTFEATHVPFHQAKSAFTTAELFGIMYANIVPTRQRQVLSRLLFAVETRTNPGPVHRAAVRFFKYIVTTNFDTLFERAAEAAKVPFAVIVPSKKTVEGERFDFDCSLFDNGGLKKRIKLEQLRESLPILLIVKVNGSCPFPRSRLGIDRWAREHASRALLLSANDYNDRASHLKALYNPLVEFFPPRGMDLYVLGHSLGAEDSLLLSFIERFSFSNRLFFGVGDDKLIELKAATPWNLRYINIEGNLGGGTDLRQVSHLLFLQAAADISEKRKPLYYKTPCYQFEVAIGEGGMIKIADSLRVLLIGQSSWATVFHLTRPPVIEEEFSVSRLKLAPDSKTEEIAKDAYFGGQMLTPALFLNRWDVKCSLASMIAADEIGGNLISYLNSPRYFPNLNSTLVHTDDRLDFTDHSYVYCLKGTRVIVDCSQTCNSPNKFESLFESVYQRLSEPGRADSIQPSIIYLGSKFYLNESIRLLKEVYGKNNLSLPIVVFETDTQGSTTLEGELDLSQYVSIVLSSALFVLRSRLVPIYFRCFRDAERVSTLSLVRGGRLCDLEKYAKNAGELESIDNWDRSYRALASWSTKRYEDEDTTASPQMKLIMYLAGNRPPSHIHKIIFAKGMKGVFSNAKVFVITLGEDGAFLFHREFANQFVWIRARTATAINTFGCGDVFRGAFLAGLTKCLENRTQELPMYLLSDSKGENIPSDLISVLRNSVAAGTMYSEFFRLSTALQHMTWEAVLKEGELLKTTLVSDDNFDAVSGELLDCVWPYLDQIYSPKYT